MKLLDLYIARHVLGGFLIVLLTIVGLDMMFALVEELKDVEGAYTFAEAVKYVWLTAPSRFYEFIPLSSLIGCLLGLGVLASNAELTVMRAAGVSTMGIILSVMKPVLVIIFGGLAIGEFVVPVTEPIAQSHRQVKITGGAIHSASKIWHRDDMTFIHINAVETDGSVRGITRYEFNDDLTLARSSFAEEGVFDGENWLLQEIEETRFPLPSADQGFEAQKVQTAVLKTEEWKSGLTPDLLKVVMVKPANLSMVGLIDYSDYLVEQGLEASQYRVAFWNKLLMPLAIFALVLIAVSFIFGPLRSVTVGQRLITGIVIGLVFKLTQDLLGPTSTVFGFSPLIAVLLPILICFAFGVWLLRRAR
ncbi:LPS export ABC transporter permease LptG [Neptuniibacter sp.]|uniref:LPS export ABC transporter permease LptG n=1 Tax=Neptuniibacter sp. TaxID=1962643 RepID=UPI0026158255|nr:LPS export ABC transporter permease LptG [Neptuniibacter sp.]MCP4597524.1 LPS export ABC transporter permease LptG [Neptuniibacter sp.]